MSLPPDPSPDRTALQSWAERADHAAFSAVVRRHLGMVHATALRRTGDDGLAEEVSMAVFALLARRAASLSGHPCISGWLHRAALLEASNALRREVRHHRLMKSASDVANSTTPDGTETLFHAAAPHLDAALEALSQEDRDAVLLRYTERLSYDAMSARLGKSADTCQKRTSRALEKLAAILRRRGVVVSCAAVGSLVSAGTTEAASSVLLGKVTAGALHQAAGISTGTIIQHAIHAMNTGKQIAAGTLLAASIAALPLLHQQSEAAALTQNSAPLPTTIKPAETPAPQVAAVTPGRPVRVMATAAEAEATLASIARLDGRIVSSYEMLEVISGLLDLPSEYMQRGLDQILALKNMMLQPVLGVALFARWGEVDPAAAQAVIAQPAFKKLHPYAKRLAESGVILGKLESAPESLVDGSSGAMDPDFLVLSLRNMKPELARKFLDKVPEHKKLDMELKYALQTNPAAYPATVEAMITAARARAADDRGERASIRERAVQIMADWNPEKAIELAGTLKATPQTASRALRQWSEGDGAAALAWLDAQPADQAKDLLDGVRPALEKMDAAALRNFAGSGPESLHAERWYVAARALVKSSPEEAIQMASDAPESVRARTWDHVTEAWANQDKFRASEWLDTLPPGPERDNAIRGFTRYLAPEDPASAMVWADSITDPAIRADIVEKRAGVWLEKDRAAATAWLEQSDTLAPAVEQALMKRIH